MANPRRLLRALEVCLLTGKPMSGQQIRDDATLRHPVRAWRLEWPREMLVQRITERTDAMLAQGWMAEAAALLQRGLLASPTARQALGYPLIAAHLAGQMDAATLRERLVVATRQYARRQATWFRHQHPEAAILAMPVDVDAWVSATCSPA
jgi:tRNA dimethylallyltransferase